MNPEEIAQVQMQQIAQMMALQLIMQNIIAGQIVQSSIDSTKEAEVRQLASELSNMLNEAAERALGQMKSTPEGQYVFSIVSDTIKKVYEQAGEQVVQTSAMHFGEMPSKSAN
ncbi:hypothetical protein LPC10_22230 [Methylorubrum sp. B1-46]|uniref:hypothetical protein n=1 Tax=Methylorubrum sp. B1-46 TaxID=2897334 RepID=UPI001E2A28CC|nr:hypothetical protein [Methylorubrum sp. B1-46]UGB25575.1 hypothetical protein LPC10_22230 [Methylorubrum sp. B1-46]